MNNPFFSIIIPTYNSALKIRESIDSIVSQTFTSYEILIMDGLSTDSTIDITKDYKDERIKIFSEKDKGIYDAMNKGIAVAQGEWLYFLGSDDLLFNNYVLADFYNFSVENPNNDVIYGDAFFTSLKIRYYGVTSLERLLLEGNLCHQAVFYHCSVFPRIGTYNLKYFLYADWDLNIRCFMHPDFHTKYVALIIANYNDAEGTSAKLVDTDLAFLNILPRHCLSLQREFFLNSEPYKIGQMVMKPFELIKRIKKVFN